MIAPSKSPITPGYGFGSTLPPYSGSNPHMGVDFQHNPDDGIYAPEDGTITSRTYMGNCGEAAELTNGANKHRFCHASQWYVNIGDKVTKGQLIGKMGDTGAAVGIHLHWILWVNSKIVDGMKYIKEDEMTEQTAYAIVSSIHRGITDTDPEPKNADAWVKRIMGDPNQIVNFANDLGASDYKGDPNFRYYGRHYSEDMATAKKQAYDQGVKDAGGDFKPVNKTLYEKG